MPTCARRAWMLPMAVPLLGAVARLKDAAASGASLGVPPWPLAPSLNRQPDPCPQSTQRAVLQHDIPAMGTDDVARDGQPQPGAAGRPALERAEHALPPISRNPRPVVVHRDQHRPSLRLRGDGDVARMA